MQFDEDILELEEREEREAFSVRNSKTVCYWNANFNKVSFRLLLVRAFKMFIHRWPKRNMRICMGK